MSHSTGLLGRFASPTPRGSSRQLHLHRYTPYAAARVCPRAEGRARYFPMDIEQGLLKEGRKTDVVMASGQGMVITAHLRSPIGMSRPLTGESSRTCMHPCI